MTRIAVVFILFSLCTISYAAPESATWGAKKAATLDELRRDFPQPDLIYAPFMFWFWDAPVDAARAAEMAEKMCAARMNPGYVHARRPMVDAPPLPDEQWLSPLWFDALDGVLEKTRAAGGYFGFCDEYWWPGGRANGRVLKAHPELKAVSLQWRTFDLAPGASIDLPESFFTVAARHAGQYANPVHRDPAYGKWIWRGDCGKVWFRKSFTLPDAAIDSAQVKIAADDGKDFFWLANNTGDTQRCRMLFTDVRGRASIWDCETGNIKECPQTNSARTELDLCFQPYEAFWLVFNAAQEPLVGPRRERQPAGEAILAGPWMVSLDPNDQPPPLNPYVTPAEFANYAKVERPLESWTKWGLAQFSGFLDYETVFTVTETGGAIMLDLGEVRHTAEVWVNGQKAGEKLWPPFVFDIGGHLHAGPNELRVRVGNLTANNMGNPQESGLLGPVKMKKFID